MTLSEFKNLLENASASEAKTELMNWDGKKSIIVASDDRYNSISSLLRDLKISYRLACNGNMQTIFCINLY